MTILQLTSHLDLGGIPRYVSALTQALSARGHRVIVASGGGTLEAPLQAARVPCWRLPLRTSADISPQTWWAMGELAVRLRQEPIDLIHAHTRAAQVVAAGASRRAGVPYVTTWHGIYRRRLGRRLWPCTGVRTIAISRMVERDLRETFHVPLQQIRCIHNGVDPDHYAAPPDPEQVQAFRRRWAIPEGVPVIGSIGRLAGGGVKGFDLLLTACANAARQTSSLHVLLVGGGPRRSSLEGLARDLGLDGRVHFTGSVEDVRVPLACLEVFVFPSRWPEGFGLTLIEAMAAGKPVIAAQSGAAPEIVRHDVDGWLVPPDDPHALAEAMARLLRDPALAQRLGRHAQQRVREAFSLERMVSEIEAVYREVVN